MFYRQKLSTSLMSGTVDIGLIVIVLCISGINVLGLGTVDIGLIVILLCISGINVLGLEHTVMDNDCGTLTIIQPVVYGRSVNFTFRPKRPLTAPSVTFFKSTPHVEILSSNMTADKGGYTYTLQSFSRNQERYIFRYRFTRTDFCDSIIVSLTKLVTELTGSGLLYMYRRPSIKVGDTVELRYMPSDDVINSKDCSRTWMLRRNDSDPVAIDDEKIVERSLIFNHEYVLVIRDIDQSLSGNISVHCGGLKSNEVSIFAAVKPSQPRFRSPQEADFEDCAGCLYGNVGEGLQLICEARGGTKPVEANITISGLKMKKDDSDGNGVFTLNHKLLAVDHLQEVTCEVTNPAVDPDRPLVTSRKLFVIWEPGLTTVSGNIVKEGHPINITCVSRQARPPPELEFVINNRLIKINALTKLRQDKLYDSIGTLNYVERQWNNQTVKCCARHALYRQDKCSEAERIQYAFGPSEVKLVAQQQQSPSTSVYVYYLVCHVTNSNPPCDIMIEGIQFLNETEDKQFVDGGWSVNHTVTIQVTNADLGRSIQCVADCTSLEKKYYSNYVISLPEDEQGHSDKTSTSPILWIIPTAMSFCLSLVVIVLVLKRRITANRANVSQNGERDDNTRHLTDRQIDPGASVSERNTGQQAQEDLELQTATIYTHLSPETLRENKVHVYSTMETTDTDEGQAATGSVSLRRGLQDRDADYRALDGDTTLETPVTLDGPFEAEYTCVEQTSQRSQNMTEEQSMRQEGNRDYITADDEDHTYIYVM